MSSVMFSRAVMVLWLGLYADWYLSRRFSSRRYLIISAVAYFSWILEKTGRRLMGRYSDSVLGQAVLGIGLTIALFHLSGKVLWMNEEFIMLTRGFAM